MNPSYQQIVDLFELCAPELASVRTARKGRIGSTADESLEMGRLALGEGDFEEAIRHFREAIVQRGIDDPAIELDLGAAYEYGDMENQAQRQYARALELELQGAEPLVGLADLSKRSGQFREAISRLEEAVRLEPANPHIRIKLADAHREAGERKRALAAARGALIVKPDDSFVHFWIGDLLLEMGRYEDALESLRAAIELSPGDDYLFQRAAVAFWRVGRFDDALKAVRLASDLDPDKHLYYGLLNRLLTELGRADEARLEEERASKMDRYDRSVLDKTLADMGIGSKAER
ncbi:MAG: tetratricopeptide repeat protein [Fimbriimonas ginsengisoli]|uniref:Tetratricopeptide repeat protein n=1 Tax=Fimbriimonas ginsengisoli TaxID=1005039 RepID=A0A931PWT2_FIMGI|nr:tetratricopeptide repeat protein [Fimbriimonas ginsengisoli]